MDNKRINIVGDKYSFTYLACVKRYGKNFKYSSDKGHPALVNGLINGTVSKNESSVVPLWNSNSGTVDMDGLKRVEKIFLGEVGKILDLWPNKIEYALGCNGKIANESRLFTVKVAKNQCSKYLSRIKRDPFNGGYNSTTEAVDAFQEELSRNDMVLCSKELLKDRRIKVIQKEIANPYNNTVFSTLNKLPCNNKTKPCYSLGCLTTQLSGDVPVDLDNYWRSLITDDEIQESDNVLLAIPKILFVLRYEESKVIVVLEMQTDDYKKDCWPVPEEETKIDLKGQVGYVKVPFTIETKELFIKKFNVNKEEIIFYGNKGTFFWGAPSLNIFVNGFEPNLVKNCALKQVEYFDHLMKRGAKIPEDAKKIIKKFRKNKDTVRLGIKSKPTKP